MIDARLKEIVSCPTCGADLEFKENSTFCISCNKNYTLKDGKIYFIDNFLEPKKLKGVFDVKKWSPLRKKNYDFYKKEVEDFYGENQIWIDLGVGPAQFRDIFKEGAVVFGIDFAPYQKADIVSDFNNSLPLKSNSVDRIFASNVFEHVSNPAFLIQECHRILKDDGVMIASTPFLLMEHQGPYDYFRYTQHSINLLSKFGFEVKNVTPLGSRRETLETTWFHFIKRTMDEYEDSDKKLPFRYKLIFKFINLTFLFLSFFIDKLKKANESDPLFTLGYGFVLIKRKD